jgi:hypothetical protein
MLGRLVVVAVAAAITGMIAVYLTLKPYLARGPDDSGSPTAALEVPDSLASARQALAGGNFRTARQILEAAQEARPPRRGSSEERELRRLHRQADLLARLLSLSLQELLHQGLRVNDDQEWQQIFRERYAGQSVLFEDMVRRDARGRPELANYVVSADRTIARLGLEDLTLWQRVPLDSPLRVLFGARLKGLSREEGGTWVVRFEPDSGVLLTDSVAAAAVCPAPLSRELQEVLRRQAEWDNP